MKEFPWLVPFFQLSSTNRLWPSVFAEGVLHVCLVDWGVFIMKRILYVPRCLFEGADR